MQPGEGRKYLEWVMAEGEVAECGLGGMCPGRKLGWRAGFRQAGEVGWAEAGGAPALRVCVTCCHIWLNSNILSLASEACAWQVLEAVVPPAGRHAVGSARYCGARLGREPTGNQRVLPPHSHGS